ncbi:INO80 isoform 6, partial [Pongo abelii]
TLNNWHQEFTRFVPKFKVLPYWGNPHDRKVIRRFWSQCSLEDPLTVPVSESSFANRDPNSEHHGRALGSAAFHYANII